MVSPIKGNLVSNKESLRIFTFGQFLVKCGDVNFSEITGRSQKTWELFKYLLTHKNNLVSSEVIAETLWPDQEFANTKGSMRVQVHRIRQVFQENLSSDLPLDICFSQGCYSLKILDCWLDADEFENLSRRAQDLSIHNAEERISLFCSAIALYRGDYLREINSSWVFPLRSYYRSLYLKNILALADLLKEAGSYSILTDILEKAFIIEPYEEELHVRYMEALLEMGKTSQARAHYDNITSVLYQETGIKPSGEFRQIYREIKRKSENVPFDFNDFQRMLNKQRETKGAFPCDIDSFQLLCNLQRRGMGRSGSFAYVTILTLTTNELLLLPSSEIQRLMDQLEQVLLQNLRLGDVICRFGENQFALLLSGLNLKQEQIVLQRIRKRYREAFRQKGTELYSTAFPLLPSE